jgi:hypothetical protein
MNDISTAVKYTLLLLLSLTLLWITGVIHASYLLILSFTAMMSGSLLYVSLTGSGRINTLLAALVLFYIGLTFFIAEYAQRFISVEHIIPAMLGIGALSSGILYYESEGRSKFGYTAVIFFLGAVVYFLLFNLNGLAGMMRMTVIILHELWLVLLALFFFIFYLMERGRK